MDAKGGTEWGVSRGMVVPPEVECEWIKQGRGVLGDSLPYTRVRGMGGSVAGCGAAMDGPWMGLLAQIAGAALAALGLWCSLTAQLHPKPQPLPAALLMGSARESWGRPCHRLLILLGRPLPRSHGCSEFLCELFLDGSEGELRFPLSSLQAQNNVLRQEKNGKALFS